MSQLTNRQFNLRLKRLYNDHVHNDGIINACYNLWLTYDLTQDQVDRLDQIKNHADRDTLDDISYYYLDEE